MADNVIVTNDWLIDRIAQSIAALNGGYVLHLFQNNVTPDPSNVSPAFFTECTFDTYSTQIFAGGTFGSAFRVVDGEYESDSATFTYNSPVTTGNTIYGWYITEGAGFNVYLSYRFPAPINFAVGAPTLQLQILYREWARSILP